MPTFELALLLRILPRQQTASALKRTAELIFKHGGIIKKLENLGERAIPYRMSNHQRVFREAHYFLYEFDVSPNTVPSMKRKYRKDTDLILATFTQTCRIVGDLKPVQKPKCTLHDELKPPVERPSVVELINKAEERRRSRKKYYSMGPYVKHYPFAR